MGAYLDLDDVVADNPVAAAELRVLREENARLLDKAIAYDLDRAGIEQRTKEAVELVELRAENARLRGLCPPEDEAGVLAWARCYERLAAKETALRAQLAEAEAAIGRIYGWADTATPNLRNGILENIRAYRQAHPKPKELPSPHADGGTA